MHITHLQYDLTTIILCVCAANKWHTNIVNTIDTHGTYTKHYLHEWWKKNQNERRQRERERSGKKRRDKWVSLKSAGNMMNWRSHSDTNTHTLIHTALTNFKCSGNGRYFILISLFHTLTLGFLTCLLYFISFSTKLTFTNSKFLNLCKMQTNAIFFVVVLLSFVYFITLKKKPHRNWLVISFMISR